MASSFRSRRRSLPPHKSTSEHSTDARSISCLENSRMLGFRWVCCEYGTVIPRYTTICRPNLVVSSRCLDTGVYGTSDILEVRNLYRLPASVSNPYLFLYGACSPPPLLVPPHGGGIGANMVPVRTSGVIPVRGFTIDCT